MCQNDNHAGTRLGPVIWAAMFFVLSASLFPSCACAEEFTPKEPVVVNGDKVEYFHEKKEVTGSGNISITYRDVMLTCEKIIVHLDTRDAIAEGNVRITQKDAYFTGERIEYNFETRKATAVDGYVNAKPFYGKAQLVEKAANKEVVSLQRGYVTTCDLEKPHYRVQSRQVKIYLDDRVEAMHVLFFLGDIPILYLPYYVQSLKDEKTHLTVTPGHSSDWGYYALTAYRYYLDDKNMGDILLDYRSKKGLGEGINHRYETKEIGGGSVKFYYTHENDNLAYERTGDMKARHRVQLRHKWDIGNESDSTATVEFNEMSDKDVIKDYFYYEYEEMGDNPDNYLSVITQKDDYSTEFLVRKRFDNFLTVVERLPEYRFDIPNYRVTQALPIYYKGSGSGVYLNETFNKNTYLTGQKDLGTIRVDIYNQVGYAAKFFRSLNIMPYAGTEDTYYSRNKWGDTNLIRAAFVGGVDASIKFYRVYDINTDYLGLDIHKIRHVITPTAKYYYTHQPTISPDNLTQFDSIDSLDKRNGILLSLENKLQTKRLKGETMQSVDLATFIISSDYAFTLKKSNAAYKYQKFKTVDLQLELVPYPWLYGLAKMSVDTKRCAVQTESFDIVGSGGDKWSLGIGHRYENVVSGKSNNLTFAGEYRINDKWKVRGYHRFDVKKSFEEIEYTVYRDLHCWIGEFTYNIKKQGGGTDNTFWIAFRLKAFPDTPIGLKRTLYRPRFGPTGHGPDLPH